MQTGLTSDNFTKGCLVDDELLGGVSPDPEQSGGYVAYVLRHTTGEYLGYQAFPALEPALAAINAVERPWTFDQAGGCGGGKCGESGNCRGGKCGLKASQGPSTGAEDASACATGACPTTVTPSSEAPAS